MTGPGTPQGGGRFTLRRLADPARMEKRGDIPALAREAGALRRLTNTGLAPRLLASRPGVIETEWCEGGPADLDSLSAQQLHELGGTLRRVHDHTRLRTGGRAEWGRRARSLAEYARLRVRDVGLMDPELGARAQRALAGITATPVADARPFRMLHGDLVAENIVWTPRPLFVDWEFWRTGDPAEDLAYLFVVNDCADTQTAHVLDGYGHPGIVGRVWAWAPVCALDAAAWFLLHGHPHRADTLSARAERWL